jgi:hypothetical protein
VCGAKGAQVSRSGSLSGVYCSSGSTPLLALWGKKPGVCAVPLLPSCGQQASDAIGVTLQVGQRLAIEIEETGVEALSARTR